MGAQGDTRATRAPGRKAEVSSHLSSLSSWALPPWSSYRARLRSFFLAARAGEVERVRASAVFHRRDVQVRQQGVPCPGSSEPRERGGGKLQHLGRGLLLQSQLCRWELRARLRHLRHHHAALHRGPGDHHGPSRLWVRALRNSCACPLFMKGAGLSSGKRRWSLLLGKGAGLCVLGMSRQRPSPLPQLCDPG